MAKKKEKFKETTIEDFYDLKVDKVDELVAALTEEETDDDILTFSINANTGVYDPKNVKKNGKEKEFDPYKRDFFARIPTWIKAIFVKWWFAGAASYFILWGLTVSGIDSVVLLGGVLGIVVDLFVNPIFKYAESDRHEFDPYMMFPFPFKVLWTFFANILYYIVVVVLVAEIYTGIGMLMSAGASKAIAFGVEPLLFGVFAVAVDMAFIGIKDGVVALVRHLKSRKKESVNV